MSTNKSDEWWQETNGTQTFLAIGRKDSYLCYEMPEYHIRAILADHTAARDLAQAQTLIRELRRQLRWAWLNIGEGCRCIFDGEDNKIAEDPHCFVHGLYIEKDQFREISLLPPATENQK